MTEVSDEAIIYQLEKVDQGGAVADLFEDRIEWVAEELGYELVTSDDPDCQHDGEIRLPDGRYAGLKFEAYIVGPTYEEITEDPL